MFNNIGEKIKGLASISATIGIILSVILGIIIAFESFLGIVIAIVGSLVSWISAFYCYGFGELVSNSTKIKRAICQEVDGKNINKATSNSTSVTYIFTDEEKEKIYREATTLMLSDDEMDIRQAIKLLSSITDYKNSATLINDLKHKLTN